MVEGLRSGFYTTSSQAKKEGRKQETTSQPSFFSQPQSFSSQQPEIQQIEQKQTSKLAHTETLLSAEKPRKQMKSVLHQEITEFNPSSQMSTEQLIKAMINLHEEVRKLKKANEKLMESNEKLMENLNKQEKIDSRLMSQERELNAFWNISQSQSSQSQNQQQKQTELDNRLQKIEEKLSTFKKEQREIGTIQMEIEVQKEQQKKGNNQKSKKMFLLREYMILLSEVLEILIEIKKILNSRKLEEEKRSKQNEKNVLQLKRLNLQDQDGINQFNITSKRKKNQEKIEFPISLKLDVPNFFIQQQGA